MKKTSAVSKTFFFAVAIALMFSLTNCAPDLQSTSTEQSSYLANNIRATSRGVFATQEDTSIIARVSKYADPEKRLKFRITRQPLLGKLNFNEMTAGFEYVPKPNANGVDSFEFVAVVDSTFDSPTHFVEVNIQSINDAPEADPQTIRFDEDVTLNGALTGRDVESRPLTFQIIRQPVKGKITLSVNGMYTYVPFANANGTDSFTFTVKDEELTSKEATVGLTINPLNDLPVAQNGNLNTNEDSPTNGKLNAQDADGDALVFELTSMPSKGGISLNNSTGVYTYTPSANANGTDSFSFRTRDGVGISNTATISIDLANINDVPVAQNLNLMTNEDSAINSQLTAIDIDGDVLTFRIFSNPSKGSIQGFNAITGNFTYVPNQNSHGIDSFQFVARDGSFDSQVKTVNITVSPVNDAPIANSLTISLDQDTSYTGTFMASDVDGDFLIYGAVTQPQNGIVTVSGNKFTYTPNAGFSGADNFTYKANDGKTDSNVAAVSVVVDAVAPPAAPVAPTGP